MEKTFIYYNDLDMLEIFTLTVFSDLTLFDGADTPTIGAHFRQWAESACRTEELPEDDSGGKEVRLGHSPRYQFCVLVDEAALHSVLHDAPAPPEIRYEEGLGKACQ